LVLTEVGDRYDDADLGSTPVGNLCAARASVILAVLD
jgi:hypothetical protein